MTKRNYHQEWRLKDPEKTKVVDRKSTLARYKMTIEDYERMLELQGGGCMLCGSKPTAIALSVDHDHACCPKRRNSCGRCIRGLLCTTCNRDIGVIEKWLPRFQEIQDYLGISGR